MKPILFNIEMVRAILNGRKTTTRRIIKPQPTKPYWCGIGHGWDDGHGYEIKPPCQIGDVLYVRETFGNWSYENPKSLATYYQYRADYPNGAKTYEWPEFDEFGEKIICDLPKWHPSLHMPKEASRIFLKVTNVRVERLQDITDEQAKHEGVCGLCYDAKTGEEKYDMTFFKVLWDSTVKKSDLGRYGWNANPFVWVIEFERCEKLLGGDGS